MSPEKFKYLEAAVLADLKEQDVYGPSKPSAFRCQPPYYVSETGKEYTTDEEIKLVFERLEHSKLAKGYHDQFAESQYEITDTDREKIKIDESDPNFLIYKYSMLGKDWLSEVLENINLSELEVEDHDDTNIAEAPTEEKSTFNKNSNGIVKYPTVDDVPNWDSLSDVDKLSEVLRVSDIGVPASDRVVTLDHNSPDYKEAISSLEGVIREFREDLHLDNELGHEKGALLKALEGGRELLDDTSINLRIGVALLIEPLKRITQKYDQPLVGALAAAAITVILKLFGVV